MSEKEKAEELTSRIYDWTPHMKWNEAKELAQMCCDEVKLCLPSFADQATKRDQSAEYWNNVKTEIEKL